MKKQLVLLCLVLCLVTVSAQAMQRSTSHKQLNKLLDPTAKLFIAIEQNNPAHVSKEIGDGAKLTEKKNGLTPLELAMKTVLLLERKPMPLGCADSDAMEVLNILLKNGAPLTAKALSIVDDYGCSTTFHDSKGAKDIPVDEALRRIKARAFGISILLRARKNAQEGELQNQAS